MMDRVVMQLFGASSLNTALGLEGQCVERYSKRGGA